MGVWRKTGLGMAGLLLTIGSLGQPSFVHGQNAPASPAAQDGIMPLSYYNPGDRVWAYGSIESRAPMWFQATVVRLVGNHHIVVEQVAEQRDQGDFVTDLDKLKPYTGTVEDLKVVPGTIVNFLKDRNNFQPVRVVDVYSGKVLVRFTNHSGLISTVPSQVRPFSRYASVDAIRDVPGGLPPDEPMLVDITTFKPGELVRVLTNSSTLWQDATVIGFEDERLVAQIATPHPRVTISQDHCRSAGQSQDVWPLTMGQTVEYLSGTRWLPGNIIGFTGDQVVIQPGEHLYRRYKFNGYRVKPSEMGEPASTVPASSEFYEKLAALETANTKPRPAESYKPGDVVLYFNADNSYWINAVVLTTQDDRLVLMDFINLIAEDTVVPLNKLRPLGSASESEEFVPGTLVTMEKSLPGDVYVIRKIIKSAAMLIKLTMQTQRAIAVPATHVVPSPDGEPAGRVIWVKRETGNGPGKFRDIPVKSIRPKVTVKAAPPPPPPPTPVVEKKPDLPPAPPAPPALLEPGAIVEAKVGEKWFKAKVVRRTDNGYVVFMESGREEITRSKDQVRLPRP